MRTNSFMTKLLAGRSYGVVRGMHWCGICIGRRMSVFLVQDRTHLTLDAQTRVAELLLNNGLLERLL